MTLPEFDDWLAHGWGIRAETPELVFRIVSAITMLGGERTYAWRGQNDSDWMLISSLYRDLLERGHREIGEEVVRARELEILAEARRWGLGRDLGASATDMHMLAVLQHHGVPTRLIDVTSNPMTALWFATEEHRPDKDGLTRKSGGALFAVDVTGTAWHETFHFGAQTYDHLGDPLAATYKQALQRSAGKEDEGEGAGAEMFRIFSALPDERMKAQEGWFLGSAVPKVHKASGIVGLNPLGDPPTPEELRKLKIAGRDPAASFRLPFCAIIFTEDVKEKLRLPLKRTYNRRPRVLFPDVDGFREWLRRNQLD